jgi:hypothetical protein
MCWVDGMADRWLRQQSTGISPRTSGFVFNSRDPQITCRFRSRVSPNTWTGRQMQSRTGSEKTDDDDLALYCIEANLLYTQLNPEPETPESTAYPTDLHVPFPPTIANYSSKSVRSDAVLFDTDLFFVFFLLAAFLAFVYFISFALNEKEPEADLCSSSTTPPFDYFCIIFFHFYIFLLPTLLFFNIVLVIFRF